jgi:hypothetical protein
MSYRKAKLLLEKKKMEERDEQSQENKGKQ